ncbi:hypothetical protein D3C79_581380 [compost metagenome]
MAVEVELGKGGAAAGQLEQLFAGLQGNFGSQHLGLGHRNRGTCRTGCVDRRSIDLVEYPSGFAQQRFGGVQLEFQAADVGNYIRVVTGTVDVGFNPRPGLFAHEGDRIIDSCFGDASVDRRLDQLRSGALNVGDIALAPVVDYQFRVHRHLVQQHGTAGGGALAEPGPVIDNAQPRAAPAHECQALAAFVVEGFYRHPMGEQGTGGVELLATYAVAVAGARDSGLEGEGIPGATFRPGIADAPAVEHAAEDQRLLRLAGRQAQQLQHAELVLRDLPQGRVGGADQAEYFGHGLERHIGAAMGLGYADAAQAAAGEQFDLGPWQFALLVAAGGLLAGDLGQFAGRLQGFGVVAQYLGRQQRGRAVQIAMELGVGLAGHQCRSLAALNALALRTGVIVILTIPDLTKK